MTSSAVANDDGGGGGDAAPATNNDNGGMDIPSVDKRNYKHLTMKHGFDVLLISDPTTDKASAACDVHVGQLCDSIPGIAHFCEHMVFIATKKYPIENEYDKYLQQHGGSSNAFTSLEHTCFYFNVQAESLEGALDRFAQCFISPLFTKSAIERERQAVDSEFGKNTSQDVWRFDQLSKYLLITGGKIENSTSYRGEDEAVTKQEKIMHPYGSFGCGNSKSLPVPQLQEKVIEFYQKYYKTRCDIYKLAVLGKETLPELEELVNKCFAELCDSFDDKIAAAKTMPPRNELFQSTWFPTIRDITKQNLPLQVHVVPIAQTSTLELQFPLREIQTIYDCKPTRYLSHLIGHEGSGSLFSLLKTTSGYIQELYADDSSKSCSAFSIFTIHMELTDLGLQNVNTVISMVFAYIKMLQEKGPQRWVWDELQTVSQLQFKFLSQRPPIDTTSTLAGWMQQYPPQHYLSGPYLFFEYKPDIITECLNSLTPDNVLIMLSSPAFDTSDDNDGEEIKNENIQTEEWYGTKYEIVPIDAINLEQWTNPPTFNELQYPHQNDMIATNFDLYHLQPSAKSIVDSVPKDQPVCIVDSDKNRIWYKPDTIFDMPKVNVLMYVSSPGAYYTSPKQHILTWLWIEWWRETCNEFTYLASMANLHADWFLASDGARGITVQCTGYNHKINVLLKHVLETQQSMLQKDPAIFERLQQKLQQQYQQFFVTQPYVHAMYYLDMILEDVYWTIEQKMNALMNQVTADDLFNFVFQATSVESLIHGNVSPQEAIDLVQLVHDQFVKDKPEPEVDPDLSSRVVQLQAGQSYMYQVKEMNDANTNNCLCVYYSLGSSSDYTTVALLAMTNHLIREPAYTQLRTQEQLGYIVHSQVKTNGSKYKGLLMLIQSDAYDPIHLQSRVDEFMNKFRSTIVEMSQEEWETNVRSLVNNFMEKNKNLGEESSRYWTAICNETYEFTRLQDVAKVVETLSKMQLLAFWDRYIADNGPSRAKLSVQVFSKPHQDKMKGNGHTDEGKNNTVDDDESGVIMIQDPKEFKKSMSLYPYPPKKTIKVISMFPQDDKGNNDK